jgi:hypothetical protein
VDRLLTQLLELGELLLVGLGRRLAHGARHRTGAALRARRQPRENGR